MAQSNVIVKLSLKDADLVKRGLADAGEAGERALRRIESDGAGRQPDQGAMTVAVVPSMIRPLTEPWPEEGLVVDGCTITIHIGGGTGVVIGLSVEGAYRVGTALAQCAVASCKLSWTEAIGQA